MPHFAAMNLAVSESDKLRDRAVRLFAMVFNAHERGLGSADHLAELANEALAQPDEMDRRGSASADSSE
jgi:hypothetical protein